VILLSFEYFSIVFNPYYYYHHHHQIMTVPQTRQSGGGGSGHEGMQPPYDFNVDDRVVYHAIGSTMQMSVGIIRDIITEPETVGSNERPVTVKASEEEPRFLIENVNTGKATPYKRENIVRLASEDEGAPGTMGGGLQQEPIVQH